MTRGGGRRIAVAASVGVAVGAVVVAGVGFDVSTEADVRGRAGALPPATATVSRQTLVDRQSESGELSYGKATAVAARFGGTVTGLAAIGSTVGRGRVLYRVDEDPVILLYGALPAYRALSPGTEGADVEQLERNLHLLGYRGFTVDDEYTAATTRAVRRWQRKLGLPRTGTVELGRVVYASGPVRVDTHKLAIGDVVQQGTTVLTHTGRARVVTVELSLADQRLARPGAAVTVTLPTGKTVPGRIAAVTTVIDSEGGQGGNDGSDAETKLEVTVTVGSATSLTGLDQATVSVGFTASQRRNVLTVPVAALLALAEGGYGVQVVRGATTTIVPVRTGLFAAGQVEISGRGLTAGLTVGMPS